MSIDPKARAWVELDLDALRENYRAIRRVVGPGVGIVAMVKSNAYGLGLEHVVRALEPFEPWAYGVACAREGGEVRRLGIDRKTIVFSPLPPDDTAEAARLGLVACVSDLEGLDRWIDACSSVGRPAEFHVEVDTGMGRCGFDWRDAPRWMEAIRARCEQGGQWKGIFTHFHGADAADRTVMRAQWRRFQDAIAKLPVPRDSLVAHVANSAGTLRGPEYAADLVRPGLFLYGGHPAPSLDELDIPAPKPVVAVRSCITLIREVPPGTTVGYGATHVARDHERWGTLAIGYGDGIRRELGNRGFALVRGRRARIIGKISMDLTVVDLTDIPDARVGDTATLVGRDGDEEITLEEIAAIADTISYEVLTGLTPRLPRLERPHA